MDLDICFLSAKELAHKIKNRELTAREVMEAFLAQIKKVNPEVNAIVNLNEEQALKDADLADQKLQAGEEIGPFHGLPIAIKDTYNVKGLPTTSGFKPFKDNIAQQDDIVTERLRNAGAIIIGKTNVPEFAAGSHTINKLFGPTRNPYNLARSAGGSSGGAAAALASGMLPFADGSDMGGSLRNPGSFNNVIGFRPSPGRVPSIPRSGLYATMGVQGPLARSVEDVAFMLTVLAGPDNRVPLAIDEPGSVFEQSLNIDLSEIKVAWSPDLDGQIPVLPEVQKAVEESAKVFEKLGCQVVKASPDFTGAEEVFQTIRAHEFAINHEATYKNFKDDLKETMIWNIEKGMNSTREDVARAGQLQVEVYNNMREFFREYDIFIMPVSQLPPFDVDLEYPTELNGVKMDNYISWMQSAYFVTVTGSPSISVPAGFTEDGLPIGLQIVGPHHADLKVLQVAHAFEQATQFGKIKPKIAE